MRRKRRRPGKNSKSRPKTRRGTDDRQAPSPTRRASGITGSGLSARAERSFGVILAGICLVGLVARVIILIEFTRDNPLAQTPISDAKLYWDWAGRIADGTLLGNTPFLSAPLYPYLLGLLRVAGGGLVTVYVTQMVLHLITAVVIGWIGRVRFGPTVGLLGAGLFLLLLEPAFDATRLLLSTLQLFLIVVLWVLLLHAQQRPGVLRCATTGLILGLNCLANPPMMILLVLIGLWILAASDRWLKGLGYAGAMIIAALAVISPATVHNALACGEFIPITAHAGITFRQGNTPEARGTYTAIPGISKKREQMHGDVIRVYQQAGGRSASWRGADRYFLGQGLDYWRSHPLAAFKLAARKLYFFLAARNYGDVYLPNAELASGLGRWLRLAPLPTSWLMGPALVALLVMLRRPVRHGPEWMLLAVPLFVTVVFWYSPRYRIPAVPVLAVASAWAIEAALRWRLRPWLATAVVSSLGASLLLVPINRAVGFDPLEPHLAEVKFRLGLALGLQGRADESIAQLRGGLQDQPDHGEAAQWEYNLANALLREGKLNEAVEHYTQAIALNPAYLKAHVNLSHTLMRLGRNDEGIEHLHTALKIDPTFPQACYNLGIQLYRRGESAQARELFERGMQGDKDMARRHYYRGVMLTYEGQPDEAVAEYRAALEINPNHKDARRDLEAELARRGDR